MNAFIFERRYLGSLIFQSLLQTFLPRSLINIISELVFYLLK